MRCCSPASRRRCSACPPRPLAEDPIDDYYSAEVQQGGWLQRIGWSWDAIQGAHYADVAYPTIAVVDSGIDGAHPEFAEDGVVDPASADCRSGRPRPSNGDLARVADLGKGHGTTVAGLAAAPANGVGIVGASPYSTRARDAHRPRGAGRPGLRAELPGAADGPRRDRPARGQPLAHRPAVAVGRRCAGASPKLVRRGALLVAATGNRGPGGGARVGYPARLPHVLAIGDTEGTGPAARPGARPARTGRQPAARRRPAAGLEAHRRRRRPRTRRPLASGAAAAVWGAHPSGLGADRAAGRLAPARHGHARQGLVARPPASGRSSRRRAPVPRRDNGSPSTTSPSPTTPPPTPAAAARCRPLACVKACTRRGIVGTTDDPEDWWAVRVPGRPRGLSRRRSARGVHSSVVQGPRGLDVRPRHHDAARRPRTPSRCAPASIC